MKKALLYAPLVAAMFTACGSQKDEFSESKIVIGDNDLSYYTADDKFSRSIGKMALGCTVTHIGNNIAITAGHCVETASCTSSDYDVTWNYRDNNKSGDLTSQCVEVLAQENNNSRDYAILRYDRAPAESLPVNTSSRPQAGDEITILSHPAGIPLAWSGWCSHEGDFSGQKFSYQCDTSGGSSGAAVLKPRRTASGEAARDENGEIILEIVGIHNLGSSYYQVNAGTYIVDIPAFQ